MISEEPAEEPAKEAAPPSSPTKKHGGMLAREATKFGYEVPQEEPVSHRARDPGALPLQAQPPAADEAAAAQDETAAPPEAHDSECSLFDSSA